MTQSLHYSKIPQVPKIHVTFEYLSGKASENVKYKAMNAHTPLLYLQLIVVHSPLSHLCFQCSTPGPGGALGRVHIFGIRQYFVTISNNLLEL